MPADTSPRRKHNPILWIALLAVIPVFFLCCGGVGVGTFFFLKRDTNVAGGDGNGGFLPSITIERPDTESLENTRAWAASTVKRLKEIEAKGNEAATKEEIRKVEQKLKDAFLNKQVRWKFAFLGLHSNGFEVDVETFFGPDIGPFKSDAPAFNGKPARKLYFRVYFENESDGVHIGRDISREQANRLHKGDKVTVKGKVIDVMLRHHDTWLMPNQRTDGVDILDDFCITLVLKNRT